MDKIILFGGMFIFDVAGISIAPGIGGQLTAGSGSSDLTAWGNHGGDEDNIDDSDGGIS